MGVAAGTLACAGPESGVGRRRQLELAPCHLESPGLSARVPARCGSFRVPEDRAQPNGRTIALNVAVLPAVRRDAEPDPLVFLAGGPGQAATESYVVLRAAFRRVQRERDIVLVDQRGTGRSNPLRCPAPEDGAEIWLLEEEALERFAARCLESLDADVRFYTTSVAMQDLDEVRAALDYERVNLYGISYGTRAALAYLRLFPERVRTLTLDGVASPTEALGLDVARDAQRALDLLVERCEETSECRDEFPDLEASLDSLIAALQTPAEVTLRHPRTGELETLALSRPMAASTIRLLSYSQETAALIPLLLRSAASGDLGPLAAQFLMTMDQLDDTIADGMGFSVVCSEDYPYVPFDDDGEMRASEQDTYLGSFQTDNLRRLCPHWPRGGVPEDFKEPVESEVPALLLSGEADPVTPPDNAEEVAAGLSRSLSLVAPGQGHMIIHRGCIPGLVAELIAAGAIDGIDPGCVDQIRPAPFFTSFTGSSP